MATARLRLRTSPLPPRIHQAVLTWIRGLNPSELIRAIATNGSLAELVRRSFPFIPMSFVHDLLTPDERRVLQSLGPQDWDRLLDSILAEAPEVGEILWAHRDWYEQEIAALRDAIVGR